MKFSSNQLLLLLLQTAAAAANPQSPPPEDNVGSSPKVYLDSGPVVGVATQLPGAPGPVNKFLGIPYAAKPVRFALSQPSQKWFAPRNATSFGKSCYQIAIVDGIRILISIIPASTWEKENQLLANQIFCRPRSTARTV